MEQNEATVENGGIGDAGKTVGVKEDPKVAAARLTSQLMSNPQVMAAFEQKLGSMVGKRSGYIDSLPKSIKRRIKALKKLQSEMFDFEAKFHEEIFQLERKYVQLYAPLYEKREAVINAKLEPTDSDCDWPSDEDDESDVEEEPKAKIVEINETKPLSEQNGTDLDEKVLGIPEFWLTVLKNVELFSAFIQTHDEPILKNLLDIKVKYHPENQLCFTLEFVFAPNEYFTNTTLTKEYTMRSGPDPDDPLRYDGPEIVSCKGCSIDWKPDKDVTVRKQKRKITGTKKTTTHLVKVNSFFNFFSPPEVKDVEEEDEEVQALRLTDFDLGQMLHEHIIPRAVLYFTGEALDNDDDDDEYEDEEEEGEGGIGNDDDDDDDDPDYVPPKGSESGPPECKQQ